MRSPTIKWHMAALASFGVLMAAGFFVQSAERSSAYYMTETNCAQLRSACERQMALGIRPRFCTYYEVLCGDIGGPVGFPTSASSSSSRASEACGPSNVRCMWGFEAVCEDGQWECRPWMPDSPFTSSSSSSMMDASCAASEILCIQGAWPQCVNGQWQCVSGSSVSSASSRSCVAQCPDGHEYRTCTEDGHPINYFADPCLGHYGSASSATSIACTQPSMDCGTGWKAECFSGKWRCVSDWNVSSQSSSSEGACGPLTVDCCNAYHAQCIGGRWRCILGSSSSSLSASSVAAGGCKVAGCSSHLCVEADDPGFSTCEWREEYACYRNAECKRQASGQCGWTQTSQLQACIRDAQ